MLSQAYDTIGALNLVRYLDDDDSLSEGTVTGDLGHSTSLKEDVACAGQPQNQMMINMLPDEALLEIFHFYKDDPGSHVFFTWSWIKLVHVCRRWRYIIFGSPRRLDLRLVCSGRTPTRLLDIWPPFPIAISYGIDEIPYEECLENIMAALECRDRTSSIDIDDFLDGSTMEKFMTAMHEPFPALMVCRLWLAAKSESTPVLPETFLGGSAPQLVSFVLRGIPFPTFPKFILSSTQIKTLCLFDIPDSGYISPELMATCLATLPNLRTLSIGFRSPISRPIQIDPPPVKHTVLPALTHHSFTGVSEYFEDFIARIDAPKIEWLTVSFFMDRIFVLPQLHTFIGHTQRVKRAKMVFASQLIKIIFWSQSYFELEIQSERLERQLSSMIQIFSQQLPFLSDVEHFELREPNRSFHRIRWEDNSDMDPSQWLELFRLLISVESLFVSERLVHRVAAALKELTGEMAMGSEMLPALRSLSLEGLPPSGPVQDAIKSFVTARQLTSQPVVIQPWEPQPLDSDI